MLGTTMLVHETFLHLVDAAQLTVTDRKHFYTYAAKTMRNIIIDLARERVAERRGSGGRPLPINTELAEQLGAADGADTLVRINDALLALEALDAELARVVGCATSRATPRPRSRSCWARPSAPCVVNGRRRARSSSSRCASDGRLRGPRSPGGTEPVRGTGAPASGHPHEG